jgi:hypothetical protein
MSKLNKILGVMVAVQLALTLFVLLRSDDTKASKPQPVLAGFDPVAVTRLQVFEAGSDKGVDLVKKGPSWVLASQWDYPVDNAKLDAALAPLGKLVAGDPITTSTAKHKQLRVGDTDFDKKVIITAGGKATTLFVGATKGKTTPVRLAGDDRVLGASGVPTGALSGTARDWVAASYSEIPRDDIDKILIERGPTKIELDRTTPPVATGSGSGSGSGSAAPAPRPWRVAIDGAPVTLAAGEELNNFEIETILSAVSNLTAEPADPKLDASKPTAVVTVTRRDGKTAVFDLVASNLTVWIKQRGLERATSLDKTRLEAILSYDRSKLVSKPETKPGPGGGSGIRLPGMQPVVPPPDGLE